MFNHKLLKVLYMHNKNKACNMLAHNKQTKLVEFYCCDLKKIPRFLKTALQLNLNTSNQVKTTKRKYYKLI